MSLKSALPILGMATLLESRKATLEEMIREKHRQARELDGLPADVRQLSAELRRVKASLKAASGGR